MGTFRMPQPIKRKNDKSQFYWLRKKVPLRLRPIIGRAEVWRTLGTADKRAAAIKCVALSAEFEAEWEARWRAAEAGLPDPVTKTLPITSLSKRETVALAGIIYNQIVEAQSDNNGMALRWLTARAKLGIDDQDEEEFCETWINEFLAERKLNLDSASRARFRTEFTRARRDAYTDLARNAGGDYRPSELAARFGESPTTKLDFITAFERYTMQGGLKGGEHGATAKRWRPKIKEFCDWVGHRDLARVTPENAIDWADHLQFEREILAKSVRDVWLASVKATAGFMIEKKLLKANPFSGIKIRGVKEGKADDEKAFTNEQARTILTATLATPSNLISAETRAARRWVPWICAYSGARVNEITSLWPADIAKFDGIWCIVIKAELTKTDHARRVPIHRHLVDQEFLEFVEQRRRIGLPLFFNPVRARGGKSANPQWQKVADRLGEWVRDSLHIVGVAPNHGWRHLFKAVARHVRMDREVEGFITGHGAGSVSERYGPRWPKTLAKAVNLYPRFRIAALKEPARPHKRLRRTRAQIDADAAAKKSLRSRQAA
jgi:hypothetical protein